MSISHHFISLSLFQQTAPQFSSILFPIFNIFKLPSFIFFSFFSNSEAIFLSSQKGFCFIVLTTYYLYFPLKQFLHIYFFFLITVYIELRLDLFFFIHFHKYIQLSFSRFYCIISLLLLLLFS